ncbi:hypothetical protein GCM10008997_19260 [Halomonas salifodinae]
MASAIRGVKRRRKVADVIGGSPSGIGRVGGEGCAQDCHHNLVAGYKVKRGGVTSPRIRRPRRAAWEPYQKRRPAERVKASMV